MTTKTATAFILLFGAANATSGCSGDSHDQAVAIHRTMLRAARSCEDLTQALRDDARTKMNLRVDAEVRAIVQGYTSYSGYGDGAERGYAGSGTAFPSAGFGTPTVAGGAVLDSHSATPAHSETETQVKGVDEADIVKADGTSLYVLHGQKLLVLDAWPAAKLALQRSIDVEGEPIEMFVTEGKAVVFSNVDGTATYTAAGLVPQPGYDDTYGGGLGYGAPSIAVGGGVGSRYDGGSPLANRLVKATVLAVDGSQPSVLRELYFEGSYLSSRRVGSKVRVILEGGAHGPSIEYNPQLTSAPFTAQQIAAWEGVRASNELAIAASSYTDWVPRAMTKTASGVVATPVSCSGFYVPTAGTTAFGITQIESFDLDAPAALPDASAIVGAVDTVYGDQSSIVLAGRSYTDPWLIRQSYGAPRAAGGLSASMPVETMNGTHLHLFDTSGDAGPAVYVASGTVPGGVKDQFAIDQKNGRVRVTTTEQRSGPPSDDGRPNQVSHVFVLEQKSSELVIAGDAGEIAPGEQLYSTRYIGDKAYVVTWHVTDPLFVIDLADSAHPRVLGELKIPGFSEYMHPLDANHLLTIGRETDDTGHQHSDGGYWYGVAIQIFDVTDPLRPTLQHKYIYDGGDYAMTEAASNHKAFTYFDDRKLLAFPYVRQPGFGATKSSGPSSTLEVFHVDLQTGIEKVGQVDHSSLLDSLPNGNYGYCGGYFDGAVRRGIFFENVVYSISYGGVLANDVSSMATPLASLKLSAPSLPTRSCGAVP